jgi:hypothetical protein
MLQVLQILTVLVYSLAPENGSKAVDETHYDFKANVKRHSRCTHTSNNNHVAFSDRFIIG